VNYINDPVVVIQVSPLVDRKRVKFDFLGRLHDEDDLQPTALIAREPVLFAPRNDDATPSAAGTTGRSSFSKKPALAGRRSTRSRWAAAIGN